MSEMIREKTTHDYILFLITKVVANYQENNLPSPTISQLSTQIGVSEELILESLEFGQMEPVSLLH